MNKSDVNHADVASGGTDTASGSADISSNGINGSSDGIDAASGVTDVASGGVDADSGEVELGKYIHERKYRNRQIYSNWGRYNESETMNAEHAAGMKNDFADLLNVPSDCNFFQFKWEKNLDSEAACSTFSCQKFFNLNLEVLSQGLDCLPFYEKVQMDKNALAESDIERCDQQASQALEKYSGIRAEFMKELEENEKLSKSLEDLTGILWQPQKIAPKVAEPEQVEEPVPEEVEPQVPQNDKFWMSHRTELKEKGSDGFLPPSSSSDESLELWLDTILDN